MPPRKTKNKQMEDKLKTAVDTLIEFLKTDKNYRRSWKDNIAMSFKDEYLRTPEVFKHDIHTIANEAADNFLKLLCK
jgi:hypothetical protein